MRAAAGAVLLGLLAAATPARAADCEGRSAEAEELAREGRLAAAEVLLRETIAADPGCAAARYALGLLSLRQLDRPGEAAEQFRRHLELKPDVGVVREWLAEAESLALLRLVMSRPLRPAGKDGPPLSVDALQELPAAKAAEGAEEEGTSEAKAAAAEGEEIAVIAFRRVRGRIVSAEGDRFEIDVGAASGVVEGMSFTVTRGGVWVGLLRATSVTERAAVCRAEAGTRVGADAGAAWSFRPGDEVAQREDVLGEGLVEESRLRKRLLGWQQEEQGFQEELKSLQERERQAVREYFRELSLAALARFTETAAKLQGEYREWKRRYASWADGVLQAREEGTENRHLAAYRDQIRRQQEVEDKDAEWKEVLLDIRADMAAFLADKGQALETRRKALERRSERFQAEAERLGERRAEVEREARDRARSGRAQPAWGVAGQAGDLAAYNAEVDRHNRELEAFRKDVEAYQEAARALQGELTEFAAMLGEAEYARERWQAGDAVYAFLSGRRRAVLVEALLNAGRYESLRGRDQKALRTFRLVLGLEPGPKAEGQARDGAELAALRLVLRGEAPTEAPGPLTPPLGEVWSVPVPGRQVGRMRAGGGRILAFSALPGTGETPAGRLVARDSSSGRTLWELDFPGLPLGDWLLREDEAVFATTGGSLYRVAAATGEVRSRLDLASGEGGPVRSLLRPVEGGLWWAVTPRNGGGKIFGFDLRDPSRSGVFLPVGEVGDIEAMGRDLLVSVVRAGRAKSAPESCLVRLPWESLAAGGTVALTPVGGGTLEWLGTAGDVLLANVVAREPEYRTHVVLVDVERLERSRRVTLPQEASVAAAAAAAGRIFALLRDGTMLAIDTGARRLQWTAELGLPEGDEDVRGGAIIGATEEGVVAMTGGATPPWKVSALDADGLRLASERISGGVGVTPAYVEGRVFAAQRDGSLSCVGVTTAGDWRLPPARAESLFLPGPAPVAAAVAGEALRAATAAGAERLAYESRHCADGPACGAPLLRDGDRLYYWSARDGRLFALAGRSSP